MDHLAEPGFRASVIATYNCYFPFYEEVVLRRMVAAGCTHNVLMVDAARCAEAFASDELRPRRAGRDYTLIPVKVGGAFHPKILLRFGKAKGALFVGSHNLTLSGFGLNDELTNLFRAEGASLRSAAAPLREAFEYLERFVPSALADVVEAYEGLKVGVPWLTGPVGVSGNDRRILTSSAAADLWSQVLPMVPKNASTAFVCAPFFDPKLAFLRRLIADVRPRELVVGIDPASAQITPREAAALSGVRFVNVAGIPEIPHRREGLAHYLHAKLIWFRGASEELLVTGSANPSVAAFLAPPHTRNAEAVVADRRIGVAGTIGIDALLAAPPVSSDDWTAVSRRMAAHEERTGVKSSRVLVATPTPHGFLIQERLPTGIVLQGFDNAGGFLGDASTLDPKGVSIDAHDVVRDGAAFLRSLDQEAAVLVVVHRTEDIAKNIGSDNRKALRQALGALEEDPSQLETLLKLTEKVIFDSEDVVRTTPLRASVGVDTSHEGTLGPATLAVDAKGRKGPTRRRSLASGDIVVLLDALTRRLGEGLPAAAPARQHNDEEEIGADEVEGGELAREAPKHAELAKACRGKVRRLASRMEAQLEVALEPDRARRGVIQLAAVLAVVRTLRLLEYRPEWRKKELELVDRADEWRLFEAGALAVTWGSNALAPRAVAEANGESFDELSMVVGLLAWFAWEIELDVEDAAKRGGQQGIEDESWYAAQLYASLAPWLGTDADAATTFEGSVARTPRYGVDGDLWLRVHSRLAERCAAIALDPLLQTTVVRKPQAGDLVVLGERFDPRVRVVLSVVPSGADAKVTFYDPDDENGERAFLASRVLIVAWSTVDMAAKIVSA
jgi:hypothetical protein